MDSINYFKTIILVAVLPLIIISSSLMYNIAEAGRTEPPKELPPQVELEAEYIGGAILVKWILPLDETQNNIAYKWVLQRSINGGNFTDIANGERDPDNKPLEEGREVNYYLDKVISKSEFYIYKMLFVSLDGRQTTESETTTKIEILRDEPINYLGEGIVLETTRALVPYNKPAVKAFSFNSMPSAYAPTANLDPLITTTLNPKNEPYLFTITPIPNPDPSSECEQILEILYKPNDNQGQKFEIYATILEQETIIRNQYLYENLVNSDKRIFGDWFFIQPSEQTIQDYENLEVQLDIDSSTEVNPLDWRQLSIYQVNFLVPTGNSAC